MLADSPPPELAVTLLALAVRLVSSMLTSRCRLKTKYITVSNIMSNNPASNSGDVIEASESVNQPCFDNDCSLYS